jgi:hypothetical protein
MTRRGLASRAAVVLLTLGALLAGAAPALAQSGFSPRPLERMVGVVPSRAAHSGSTTTSSNLLYHSGPVMHTNATYSVFWIPAGYSVSSNYTSLINRFFGDVGSDSGKSSNVYFSDTQYFDNANGNILYSSALGGTYVDTNPFPANGCRDRYTKVCLSDAQLQSELQRVMSANGWTGGLSKAYFMLTPKGVGSCDGSACAFSYYCAYHSWIGSGSTATLYANMPYADTVSGACDSGQHPNGDDADGTINVMSHEHNETVTDPLGNAWYDRNGNEDGDKCAWNFGSSIGSTSSGPTTSRSTATRITCSRSGATRAPAAY